MTLFSYILSLLKVKNFKEPLLLGKLLKRSGLEKTIAKFTGWTVHYAVGLLFAEMYALLWEKTDIPPSASTGLVLGGLSGLAAILVPISLAGRANGGFLSPSGDPPNGTSEFLVVFSETHYHH